MIKLDYLGKEITISQGRNQRKIEIYEGMPIGDINFLKAHGIDVLEEVKKEKKPKKYKGIEEKNENTEEENGEA